MVFRVRVPNKTCTRSGIRENSERFLSSHELSYGFVRFQEHSRPSGPHRRSMLKHAETCWKLTEESETAIIDAVQWGPRESVFLQE
jgi:hypothetical protein